MKRAFSLRGGDEFQRAWDEGKSWSHSLAILRVRANGTAACRFGFVAGKKIGSAVARNRAKRLLREAVRPRVSQIQPGWDVILIARSGAGRAPFAEMDAAVDQLLRRANLIGSSNHAPRDL